MKRFGYAFAFAVLVSLVAGCDSGGLKEGAPQDTAKNPMSDSHKAFMEKNAGKMNLMKGKPKNIQ